jgi:hypothetical protein
MITISNDEDYKEVSKAFKDSLTPLQREIFIELEAYNLSKISLFEVSNSLLKRALDEARD